MAVETKRPTDPAAELRGAVERIELAARAIRRLPPAERQAVVRDVLGLAIRTLIPHPAVDWRLVDSIARPLAETDPRKPERLHELLSQLQTVSAAALGRVHEHIAA